MKPLIVIFLFPIVLFASTKNVLHLTIEKKKNTPSISTFKVKSRDYQTLTRIKMSEAISIAQSKSDGRIIESSLESENDYLIYSITFLMPDKSVSEVKIDAGTGSVLDIEIEKSPQL